MPSPIFQPQGPTVESQYTQKQDTSFSNAASINAVAGAISDFGTTMARLNVQKQKDALTEATNATVAEAATAIQQIQGEFAASVEAADALAAQGKHELAVQQKAESAFAANMRLQQARNEIIARNPFAREDVQALFTASKVSREEATFQKEQKETDRIQAARDADFTLATNVGLDMDSFAAMTPSQRNEVLRPHRQKLLNYEMQAKEFENEAAQATSLKTKTNRTANQWAVGVKANIDMFTSKGTRLLALAENPDSFKLAQDEAAKYFKEANRPELIDAIRKAKNSTEFHAIMGGFLIEVVDTVEQQARGQMDNFMRERMGGTYDATETETVFAGALKPSLDATRKQLSQEGQATFYANLYKKGLNANQLPLVTGPYGPVTAIFNVWGQAAATEPLATRLAGTAGPLADQFLRPGSTSAPPLTSPAGSPGNPLDSLSPQQTGAVMGAAAVATGKAVNEGANLQNAFHDQLRALGVENPQAFTDGISRNAFTAFQRVVKGEVTGNEAESIKAGIGATIASFTQPGEATKRNWSQTELENYTRMMGDPQFIKMFKDHPGWHGANGIAAGAGELTSLYIRRAMDAHLRAPMSKIQPDVSVSIGPFPSIVQAYRMAASGVEQIIDATEANAAVAFTFDPAGNMIFVKDPLALLSPGASARLDKGLRDMNANMGSINRALRVQAEISGVPYKDAATLEAASHGIPPAAGTKFSEPVKQELARVAIPRMIQDVSSEFGIAPTLLAAQVQQESGGKINARSSKGAEGLMQVIPKFAVADVSKWLPEQANLHKDLKDPKNNMWFGAAYMAMLMAPKELGGYGLPNEIEALAAYNWGPTRWNARMKKVEAGEEVPAMNSETQTYVENITLAAFGKAVDISTYRRK